jgi:hypothetical protein
LYRFEHAVTSPLIKTKSPMNVCETCEKRQKSKAPYQE